MCGDRLNYRNEADGHDGCIKAWAEQWNVKIKHVDPVSELIETFNTIEELAKFYEERM